MSVADKLGLGPRREIIPGNNSVTIKVTAPRMFNPEGKSETVRLTMNQYKRYLQWRYGSIMIQEALPDLSAEDRERLINGSVSVD